jgi:hypothetical protein
MKLGMFAKIKLLFKVSKPLGDTMKEIQQTKAGWKTPAFWTTLIGGLVSTVLALQGVIPPEAVGCTDVGPDRDLQRAARVEESTTTWWSRGRSSRPSF